MLLFSPSGQDSPYERVGPRFLAQTPHHAFRETPTAPLLPYPLTARISATKQGRDTRTLILPKLSLISLPFDQKVNYS